MVRNLENHEIVPWLETVVNFGEHYYPETNSFVCPVRGVYIFNTTIRNAGGYISVGLHLNSQLISFTSASDEAHYDTGSSNCLIECRAGDIVSVIVSAGGDHSHPAAAVHTFTGFLLNRL